MKSTPLNFAFVEPAGADSERKLREFLSAPEAKTNRNGKPAEDPPQFWTWFIDNPRPESSK
jgi:hypothetical protein